MSKKPAPKDPWLQPLNRKIGSSFSASKAKTVKQFAKSYFASTANSELAKFTDEEIFDSVSDAWNFLQVKPTAAPKIHFIQRVLDKDLKRQNETSIFVLLNDMPFLVDSLRQCLSRNGVIVRSIHNTVLHVDRIKKAGKTKGKLKNFKTSSATGLQAEALSCINCAHISDSQFKEIESALKDVLKNVSAAVKDFVPMCMRAREIQQSLKANSSTPSVSKVELDESIEFISWLLDNHFTFLGYEKYRIKKARSGSVMELDKGSILGVSRFKPDLKGKVNLKSLPKGTANLILKKQVCSFAKSSNLSKVHRPAYYDYVLLKEFDEKGDVVTEHRFLGLYTSSVYFQAAVDIPLVRKKVEAVLKQSGFAPNGHSIKDLLQVINVFPRDELFQISEKQLFETAIEITQIQETQTSKLFIRKDSYGKFYSCLVYIPRDIFNTRVREQIQAFLENELQARETEFTTYMSESLLVRLHFILRVDDIQRVKYKREDLESRLVQMVKPWDEYFLDALRYEYLDNEADRLHDIYSDVYTAAYKETYFGVDGLRDIARIEEVCASKALSLDLNTCSSSVGAQYSFKIFSYQEQLFLSNVAPILENLGLGIISEKAFKLSSEAGEPVWLHDFSLYGDQLHGKLGATLKENFEEGFRAVWERRVDDDGFNALIISANLNWRDVALLRAYAAYMKQIQFGYTGQFIAETLSRHGSICELLVSYFYALLSLDAEAGDQQKQSQRIRTQLHAAIDKVANLSEDSVLRAYLNLIDATQRTNFFQTDPQGSLKDYFSFKFIPEQIRGIPLPKPKFEIFVYSRSMEGVHLRGGSVARGGLRWSDRGEDYRTEILGLVKAQQVKNSVIVPVGAKGGFVSKAPASDREQFMAQGVASYKTFISGLLDITDNLVDGKLVPPQLVVRRDDDDPYLVVAADKGTATFSDIANGIANDYGFWLGDGFASGGSNGYDHKQMGITARGAWVSVQRHFRELGTDVQKEDFTVVGIGDMSGDVFGNGMLLSRHICLVAAFNHLHIFVDPDPDSASSFRERQRLFKKSRSSWSDYNAKLISKGGGIFSRSEKSITVSPEMKQRFAIEDDVLTPDQLIHQLLKSPVDLIWNGGIGTYVKASSESHSEVGDKTNDGLRINGKDLRCRVIGEGGNLGLTQEARIEYGLSGGISVTDFVDNSAGVDCSDHEVNIKILLNELQNTGRLSENKRNSLLESMTDDVSELVLQNNYAQVQAIGIARAQAETRHREYSDLAAFLENHAGLDRNLEFLPDSIGFEERSARQQYLTRPEIAVLTSYMKMHLKATLVNADYLDDPYLASYLYSAFPNKLVKSYREEMHQHPLRREIIATQLANEVVNILGPSFVYRMVDSTASTVAEVVKATIIAMDIFGIRQPWADIESLDYKVPSAVQSDMMARLVRLIRRVTRWLLRNRRGSLDCETEIAYFEKHIAKFNKMLPARLPDDFRQMYDDKLVHLTSYGVPDALAASICRADFLFPATSLAEISETTGESLSTIVNVYYELGEQLQLNWLGKMINQLPVSNYWQALARETYLDDLSWQQRALTCNVVGGNGGKGSASSKVKQWMQDYAAQIVRSSTMLNQLQAEPNPDYSMFSVALRELLTLAQSTAYGSPD